MEQIDEVDRALVEQLRIDGRMSSRSLGQLLGISEVTVAARIRRMAEASVMRVVAVTDMRVFGHREFAFATIRTSGRPLLEIGAEVARLPETVAVLATTGRYDLVVPILGRDHGHLADLFGTTLPAVSGIDEVTGHLTLDVLKFESNWALLSADPGVRPDTVPGETVDQLDLDIIQLLQVDARRSNRSIAAELDVSEGTVRGRIRRLVTDRVIRIQAVSDILAFGIGAHAFVGIKAKDARTDEVGKKLAAREDVAQLSRTLGEFDFIAVLIARDRAQLVQSLVGEIAVIPGIRRTETFETCATMKHAYAWSWLV